jgi:hypothetical protein
MATKKKKNTFSERSWRKLVPEKRRRPMSWIAWRRAFIGFGKALLLVCSLAGVGFGSWKFKEYLATQSGPVDLTGPSVPIASVTFASDGVLDHEWILQWLDLPTGKTLMDLDIANLQQRLTDEPQVSYARVSRIFPDVLRVELKERKPILRLGLRKQGKNELWLLSEEGIVYQGQNYTYASLDLLPWLELAPSMLEPDGRGGYLPLHDLTRVSPLLAHVRRDYPEIYRDLKSLSFLRPTADESDPGAYVQLRSGKVRTIRFAPRDYPAQLRRLRYLLLDPSIRALPRISSIDLSHGRSVFADLRPT